MSNKKSTTINDLIQVLKKYDGSTPIIFNGETCFLAYLCPVYESCYFAIETEKYSSQFPDRDTASSPQEQRDPPVKVKKVTEVVEIGIDVASDFILSVENFKKHILEKHNVELSDCQIDFEHESCHDYDRGEYIETRLRATFNVQNENYEKEYEAWRAWVEENDKRTAKQLRNNERQKDIAQAKKDYKLQQRNDRVMAKKA